MMPLLRHAAADAIIDALLLTPLLLPPCHLRRPLLRHYYFFRDYFRHCLIALIFR